MKCPFCSYADSRVIAYAYRDRKNNKRNFRALWIQRINAAARNMRRCSM